MNTEKTVVEDFKEDLDANEESVGKKAVVSPFAWIALFYMTILAIACIALAYTFSQW